MVNGINEKKLQKYGNVKLFYFWGARIKDMNHHLMPIITKRSDYLILQVGTIDTTSNTSREIIENQVLKSIEILTAFANSNN